MKTSDHPRFRNIIWAILIAGFLAAGILLTYLILQRAPSYHRAYNKGVLELRNKNPQKALEYFRHSMQENPEFLDARRAVIRTLLESNEFEKAESEVRAAIEAGLSESAAAHTLAQIRKARADHRVNTAGEKAAANLYDEIIKDDIDPAIESLHTYLDSSENAASTYTLLGELLEQKGAILTLKQLALHTERETAVKLEHAREVAAKDFEIKKTLFELRTARFQSLDSLNKAIELDPEFAPPRLAAADYAISRYKPQPEVARKMLAPLLETDPPNTEAVMALIVVERMEGNHEAALKHIRALRVKWPQFLQLAIDEIEVLFDLERWEEAAPLVENIVLENPDDPRAYFVHGKLLLHQGNFEEAARALERIFFRETLPWPEARFLLAEALLKSGNSAQAVTAYEETIKNIDAKRAANVKMYERFQEIRYACHLNIGRLVAEKEPGRAANHAKHAFDIFRDQEDAYQNVRAAYIAAGYPQQVPRLAVTHISAVEKTQGSETALELCRKEMANFENSPLLRMLEATLLMHMGSYTEAIEAIQKLAEDFPDDSSYLRALARLHIQLGHVEKARKIYEAILVRDPFDSSATGALLGLLMGNGQMDAVRDLLARAQGNLGPQKLRTLTMGLALAEKKPGEAIQLAEDHVHANPFSAPAHELLAMLLWQHGDPAKARKSFSNALNLDPAYRMAYRRGLLDIEEGRFQDAIDLFSQAVERMPNFPAVRVHLAAAFAANGQIDAALRTLDEVQGTIMDPGAEDSVVQWLSALMHAAQGDIDRADFYNRRVKFMPFTSAADRRSLLDSLVLLQAQDRHVAATALSLHDIFTNNGCLKSAEAQLRRAQELMPAAPLIPCWLAQIYTKQGEPAKAIELLERTVKQEPASMPARLILAETYVQTGNLDQAAETLESSMETVPKSYLPRIHLRLANIQDNLGLYDQALENYKLAMDDPQTEAVACSEAAWILATAKGAPEKAVPYARRSLQLRPDDPAVLDTLGWALLLCGDVSPALEHLKSAKRRLPSNPRIRYHLAKAYVKAGLAAEAKAELTEALTISDSFPEASDARLLQEEL